jgi:hypothetical protein
MERTMIFSCHIGREKKNKRDGLSKLFKLLTPILFILNFLLLVITIVFSKSLTLVVES